jgi:hypothetical protein
MSDDEQKDDEQKRESVDNRTPVEALLAGEPVGSLNDSFENCSRALVTLTSKIDLYRGPETPNALFAPLVHAQNLALSIWRLLSDELVQLVGGGTKAIFQFGQLFRPYDLDFLARSVDAVTEQLEKDPDNAPSGLWVLVAYLQSWVDFVVPSVLAEVSAGNENSEYQISLPPALVQMEKASDSLRRLSNLERQAEATVENLKTAAGEGGKERLAQTFEVRGKEEAKSAAHWNWLVMTFVLLGIALPLVAISLEDHFLGHLTGTYGIVIKALIAVPMFALATYCGRISAQHRKIAQHMKTLTAQIDSVKAYVAALPSDDERQLIMTLGMRAFSEPGVAGRSEGVVGVPPEDVLPALEKAVQTIKELRK